MKFVMSSAALAIFREINNAHNISVALGVLGSIYSDLGDYSKALDHSIQSLEVARSAKDHLQVMTGLTDLPASGRRWFRQALPQTPRDLCGRPEVLIAQAFPNFHSLAKRLTPSRR